MIKFVVFYSHLTLCKASKTDTIKCKKKKLDSAKYIRKLFYDTHRKVIKNFTQVPLIIIFAHWVKIVIMWFY